MSKLTEEQKELVKFLMIGRESLILSNRVDNVRLTKIKKN